MWFVFLAISDWVEWSEPAFNGWRLSGPLMSNFIPTKTHHCFQSYFPSGALNLLVFCSLTLSSAPRWPHVDRLPFTPRLSSFFRTEFTSWLQKRCPTHLLWVNRKRAFCLLITIISGFISCQKSILTWGDEIISQKVALYLFSNCKSQMNNHFHIYLQHCFICELAILSCPRPPCSFLKALMHLFSTKQWKKCSDCLLVLHDIVLVMRAVSLAGLMRLFSSFTGI